MTYVVMDNRIYGLTKGQALAYPREGLRDVDEPRGPQTAPGQPARAGAGVGCDVHRAVVLLGRAPPSGDPEGGRTRRVRLRERLHSPCVTFNDVDTYDYFRDSLVDLKESDHDPSDKEAGRQRRHLRRRYGASGYHLPGRGVGAVPRASRRRRGHVRHPGRRARGRDGPRPRVLLNRPRARRRFLYLHPDLRPTPFPIEIAIAIPTVIPTSVGSPKSGDPAGSQPVCDRFQQA